jgi:hypothetical protein
MVLHTPCTYIEFQLLVYMCQDIIIESETTCVLIMNVAAQNKLSNDFMLFACKCVLLLRERERGHGYPLTHNNSDVTHKCSRTKNRVWR